MNASEAGRHGSAPTNSANMYGGGVCVVAHACAPVRAHACMRDMFAIYDNNI